MSFFRKKRKLPSQEQVLQALQDFISADSEIDRMRIVEGQRDLLLSDEADKLLTFQLEQYKENPDVLKQIEEYQDLLQRCREEGIERAFSVRVAVQQTVEQLQRIMEERRH